MFPVWLTEEKHGEAGDLRLRVLAPRASPTFRSPLAVRATTQGGDAPLPTALAAHATDGVSQQLR